MTAPASIKEELHEMIERMSATDAQELLDYLNMRADPDELTSEEEDAARAAREEYVKGETMAGAELERELGLDLSV